MSRLKRDKARKRLGEMLALAPDESFIIMIWAIDALQSDREIYGAQFLKHPKEARGAKLGNRFHANKWMLETLINELLMIKKKEPNRNGRSRILNCGNFSTLVTLLNTLLKWEDAEDVLYLRKNSVLNLMPKLGHRQFEWQRGFFSYAQIYRSMRLFGGVSSSSYFLATHGLTIAEFFNCGFACYALCTEKPGIQTNLDLTEIGIGPDQRDAALRMLTVTVDDARSTAQQIRTGIDHVAYKKSVLRRTPLLLFNDGKVARPALIDLIMHRVVSGLYYDLVGGGSSIWREIGAEFEAYCYELTAAMLSTPVVGAFKYKFRKGFDSPDILIEDPSGTGTRLIVECKAKKMSFAAKFSDDPIADARLGFSEIIKGVVQVWRFISHCRRNPEIRKLHASVKGIILTLDPWLMVSTYRKKILEEAKLVAAQIDPEITAEDQKHILFCSIDDLEGTLQQASIATFISAIEHSATPEYDGWSINNIHDQAHSAPRKNEYPFIGRIAEVNPGWNLEKVFGSEKAAP